MESDINAKRRKNMRDFRMMKKKQIQNLSSASEIIDKAWAAISEGNPQRFQTNLVSMSTSSAFSFFLTEDQLKRTPITVIIEQKTWIQFINIINKWSHNKKEEMKEYVKEGSIKEHQRRSLERNFYKIHQETVRKLVSSSKDSDLAEIVAIFSKTQTYFSVLFLEYFDLSIILTFLAEQDACRILSEFYAPIAQNLNASNKIKKQIKTFIVMIKKQSIWKSKNFLQHLEEPELLILNIVNFNFLHQLAEDRDIDTILKIINQLSNLENQNTKSELFSKYFSIYNTSNETPLDVILRKWKYQQIQDLLKRIEPIQQISVSINCLNKVIGNVNLSQKQVEELIEVLLKGQISEHGYNQNIQTKSKKTLKTKTVCGDQMQCQLQCAINPVNHESISTTDRSKVLKAKTRQSYPLLGYLNRFKSKSNLAIVQKLFFKSLQRKTIKKLYYSALHEYGVSKQIVKSNEIFKSFQEIQTQLNPLLETICRLQNGDVLEYLIDKLLLNYMFIRTYKKYKIHHELRLVSRHFIVYYIENHEDLSENQINKKIYDKVTDLKDFSKISDKYNHVGFLTYSLGLSKAFRESEGWLTCKIKEFVRKQIIQYQKNNQLPYQSYISEFKHIVYPSHYNNYSKFSIKLDYLFNGDQLKKYQSTSEKKEQDKIKLQFAEAYALFRKNRSLDTLAVYLQERVSRKYEYEILMSQHRLYISIEQSNFQSKMKLLAKFGVNFYISVIRLYDEGNQNKYDQVTTQMSTPYKGIAETMLRYRTKKMSMSYFSALVNCRNQDIGEIIKLISVDKSEDQFVSLLTGQIETGNPKNFLLMHKIQKIPQFTKISQTINRKFKIYLNNLKDTVRKNDKQRVGQQLTELLNAYIIENQRYDHLQNLLKVHPFFDLSDFYAKIDLKIIVDTSLQYPIYGCDIAIITLALITSKKPIQYYQNIAEYYPKAKKIQTIEQLKRKREKQPDKNIQDPQQSYYEFNFFRSFDIISVIQGNELQNFFKKMNLQQFKQFIEVLKPFENTQKKIALLRSNIQQEKKLYILDRLIQTGFYNLDSTQVSMIRMNSQEMMFNSAIFALYLKPKFNISFHALVQDKVKPIEARYYLPLCRDEQYHNFMKYMKKLALSKSNENKESADIIANKLISSFQDLINKKCWDKIFMLLDCTNAKLNAKFTFFALDYFANNIASTSQLSDAQKQKCNQCIEKIFEMIEKGVDVLENPQLIGQMMRDTKIKRIPLVNAYILDPVKALNVFKTTSQSLTTWATCLHHRPESAQLIIQKQVKASSFPTNYINEVRLILPFSSYSIHQLQSTSYLIDLMKLQILFAAQWKQYCDTKFSQIGKEFTQQQKKQLYAGYNYYMGEFRRKKLACFMTKQAQQRHKQLYSEEQLKQFSYLIFMNNVLNSINDVPKQYLDAYVSKYGTVVKQVQNLHTNVIKELIDAGYIKQKEQFWGIIKTCRNQVIQYYLKKLEITIDAELVRSVQKQKGQTLLEKLLLLENQTFVIEFINKYQIFEKYGEQFQNPKILHKLIVDIATLRRVSFLRILLDKLEQKHIQIQYCLAGDEDMAGFKDGDNLYLPKQVILQNSFYQYYFLLKQSGNHKQLIPDHFNLQERYLFAKQNQDYKEYQFLPEMKKRLIFLNQISRIIPMGRQPNNFCNKLIPSIIFDQERPDTLLFRAAMNGTLNCQYLQKTEDQKKNNTTSQIYAKLYILRHHPQLNIKQTSLLQKYKDKLAVVEKIEELAPPSLENIEAINNYLCNKSTFSDIVLGINPSLFFNHVNHEKFLDQSLEYLDGFVKAFRYFEKPENQSFGKQYIDRAFFENYQQLKPSSANYGDYRLKYLLILSLVSYYQGTCQLTNYIAEKMNEKSEQCLQNLCKCLRHQKQGINCGFFWQKLQIKVRQISTEFNSKGKYTINCESSFQNTKQVLENTLSDLPDIYKFISVARNSSYLESQLTIIKKQIKQIQLEAKNSTFALGKQFKYQKVQIQEGKYSHKFIIAFEAIKEINSVILILQLQNAIRQIKRIKYLKEIEQKGSIELFNCLGNLKFKFDYESFKDIKDYEYVGNIFYNYTNSFSRTPLAIILQYGQHLNDKVINQHNGFSLSDVSGPFPINDETDKSKVLECISFYQYSKLPDTEITIKYTNTDKIENGAQKMLSDIEQYLRYFNYEINDDQILNKTPYKFNTTINLYHSEQRDRILYDQFYLHNIIQFFTRINTISQQYSGIYGDSINIRYSVKDVFDIVKRKTENSQLSSDNVISQVGKFLNNPANNALVQSILFMVIDDANNIMDSLKGMLIKYEEIQSLTLKQNQNPYKINDDMIVYGLKYKMVNSIFHIIILYKQNDMPECVVSVEDSNLISRKDFLEMIFSSTEFLTDYFFQKKLISNQMMKISQQLSKALNMTINCSADYGTLYSFIDKYKDKVQVKQIDTFLVELRRYILGSFNKNINNYLNSKEIKDKHSILMHNKFQSVLKGVQLSEIYEQKQFVYENDRKSQESALNEVRVLGDLKIQQNQISIKNMFLIQIYKSHFASVVREGMAFIVGYQHQGRSPIAILLKKKQDVNAVNISEVGFLLLITNRLPTNDELNHSKILRIFISDLNQNITQINQSLHSKLLELPQQSQDRNISQFIPPIQPNIILTFKSELGGLPNLKDNQQHKYFYINLNQKKQFKLEPDHGTVVTLINYLKIDNQYNQLINNFMSALKKICQLRVNIIVPKKSDKILFFESLRFLLYDLENILNSILLEPIRNHLLEAYVSLEKKEDIMENYILKRKKDFFNKIFQNIEITTLQSEQQSKITIVEKTIKISLKIANQNQSVDRNIMYKTIITQLIKQTYDRKQDVLKKYSYDTNQDNLINIIDYLVYADIQVQIIEKILKLAQKIQPEEAKANIPSGYKLCIGAFAKSKIAIQDKEICFKICSSSPDRIFFNDIEILTFLFNNNQQNAESVTTTKFLPDKQTIQIINYQQVPSGKLILISGDNAEVREVNFIHDQKNITRASFPFDKSQAYSSYYLAHQFGGFIELCSNYFIKIPQLSNNLKAKDNHGVINQENSIVLVAPTNINLNKCPVNYCIRTKNNEIGLGKISLVSNKYDKLKIKLHLLDYRTIMIRFTATAFIDIKFTLENYSLFSDQDLKSLSANIVSNSSMVIQKTKFVEMRFRGKTKEAKNSFQKDEDSLRYKIFKEPPQKSSAKLVQLQMGDKPRDVESMVYIVNETSKKYITRAGQKRGDVITPCDQDQNPVKVSFDQLEIFFKHKNLNEIIKPSISQQGENFLLEWTPTIRGQYQIYINDIRLNPSYQLGVCAACADLEKSKIEIPKKTAICFGEQTQCTLQLKDSYNNIYTQLQENIIGDKLIIDVMVNDESKKIGVRNQTINKYGFKKIKFWIDDPTANQQLTLTVTVMLNKQPLTTFDILLKGQALSERMKKLDKQINNAAKGYYKDILVSRRNFLADLFKIAEKSLMVNFSVKFTGEQGIDAGGLKRQFYDMIGAEFKNATNPFFKCINADKNAFFISPNILKNKKQSQYAELIGKYLANSIINSYLIGVNFSQVFVKMLYGDKITYEDMFEVLPKQQAQRYKFLLNASADQFEDLSLYFSVVVDRKKGIEIQLVENGSQTPVTKENVEQYLSLMTKVLITDRFKDIIENMKKGFESVIPLNIVTRWVRPSQFWALTIGIKQINADIVTNYINFKGGHQMHENWMRRYLKQSNTQILEGFLKFASGSSSIDFYQTYKVVVTFQKTGPNPKKLPISHTCWKQIIIPCYKSYDILKQLLNAAFLYCSEGFGLA